MGISECRGKQKRLKKEVSGIRDLELNLDFVFKLHNRLRVIKTTNSTTNWCIIDNAFDSLMTSELCCLCIAFINSVSSNC